MTDELQHQHFMVDLETMSSESGAAIVSIGAYAFDINGTEWEQAEGPVLLGSRQSSVIYTDTQFHINISLESSIREGFKISGDWGYASVSQHWQVSRRVSSTNRAAAPDARRTMMRACRQEPSACHS